MDGNNTHIDFDTAMKERFGGKVYRLSLSTGCTCPNRDGKSGFGGCIFCSEGGSGEFAEDSRQGIDRQIEMAKEKVSNKLSKNFKGYIAYFQSFSNTYFRSESEEKRVISDFYEAARHTEILALSIATRPDCITNHIVETLSELNKIKPVWVELGLQTIHEDTAKLINRGYKLSAFDEAVRKLKAAGLEVIVHVMIGLPNETDEMIKETVRYVSQKGIEGIKFSLLYILKNTKLGEMYMRREICVREFTLDSFIGLLKELIEILPEDTVIHRFTGDPPKKLLLAPAWTADKKRVHNAIKNMMHKENASEECDV